MSQEELERQADGKTSSSNRFGVAASRIKLKQPPPVDLSAYGETADMFGAGGCAFPADVAAEGDATAEVQHVEK